jgi:hypothetical protein
MVKAGSLVTGIAAVHCVVGVALAPAPLRAIWANGVIGAIDPHLDRIAVFWFMFFGLLMFLLGEALRIWEASATLPVSVGYGFGALSLAGAIAMPVSGFWLGLVPAALIVVRSRRVTASHALGISVTEL